MFFNQKISGLLDKYFQKNSHLNFNPPKLNYQNKERDLDWNEILSNEKSVSDQSHYDSMNSIFDKFEVE